MGSYATIRAAWFSVARAAGRKKALARTRVKNLVEKVAVMSAAPGGFVFVELNLAGAADGGCDGRHAPL